jgi:transposase InsO family protein
VTQLFSTGCLKLVDTFRVQEALEGLGSQSAFIAPGSPWQNGKNERFNGIISQELLKNELWSSVLEAQTVTRQWLVTYNTVRPHGSLGLMTPHHYATQTRQQGLWFSDQVNTG